MSKSKYVITISRQFGSMGRPIAKLMAEKLGIEYYDRDLVDQAAEKLSLPVSVIEEREEPSDKDGKIQYKRMAFPLGKKSALEQDQIFEAQKNIIKFLADKETCIIVGRCGDFILSDQDNVVNIYIYASYEDRLQHCIKDLGMEEDEARRMITAVGRARDDYYLKYAGYKPDDKQFKDIMINSSFLGIEGTADFLVDMIRRKFCPDKRGGNQ